MIQIMLLLQSLAKVLPGQFRMYHSQSEIRGAIFFFPFSFFFCIIWEWLGLWFVCYDLQVVKKCEVGKNIWSMWGRIWGNTWIVNCLLRLLAPLLKYNELSLPPSTLSDHTYIFSLAIPKWESVVPNTLP